MSLFAWKDSYGIGVPEIDAQHRRLYSLADELHQPLNAGKGKNVVQGVLKNLIDYCQSHFAAEERLMQRCNYPELGAHKAEHEMLTKKVLALEQEFRAGEVMLSVEMMRFLGNWLRRHIAGSDRKYAPFVTSRSAVYAATRR